jgi:hypothetical protein
VELIEYAQVNEEQANDFNGFRLGYMGPRVQQKSTNLISVSQHMAEVDRKINREIEKGRVGGPFEVPPFINL